MSPMTPAEIVGIGFAVLAIPTGLIAYLWTQRDKDHDNKHSDLEKSMKEAATKADVERLFASVQDLSTKIATMTGKLPNGELKRIESAVARLEAKVEYLAEGIIEAVKKADAARHELARHEGEAGMLTDRVGHLEDIIERRKGPRNEAGDRNTR